MFRVVLGNAVGAALVAILPVIRVAAVGLSCAIKPVGHGMEFRPKFYAKGNEKMA